ncbi:MAG: hypothetical protein ACI84D_000751 [Thalassolituus oleivorans]|jgi:hypothetical protein
MAAEDTGCAFRRPESAIGNDHFLVFSDLACFAAAFSAFASFLLAFFAAAFFAFTAFFLAFFAAAFFSLDAPAYLTQPRRIASLRRRARGAAKGGSRQDAGFAVNVYP